MIRRLLTGTLAVRIAIASLAVTSAAVLVIAVGVLVVSQSLFRHLIEAHGATAAALLDTAMGCAISTMLPAGQTSVTLDLKLTYLRPLSVKSGTIQAEGKIIKLGRQTSYAEGFVSDGAGNLAVHATATFSMIGQGAKPK